MAKAYSYVRFSSAEQRKGDSLRRQLKAARDYCALYKLELDTELTLHDLGVSGLYGDNLNGALGAFLKGVANGVVAPGSTLIVENIDRLTRQDVWTAVSMTLPAIINAGVTLVTLSPERTINQATLASNPFLLMEVLLYMIRANEESAIKRRRARETWEGRRIKAAGGVPQRFGKLPSWIRLVEGRFQIIEDRAAIVRELADAVLAGKGQLAIARDLNARSVPPLRNGKLWHKGNIYAVLRQPSVMGTLIPTTTARAPSRGRTALDKTPLDPIESYYPAILDREKWDRLQDVLNSRAARGMHANRPLRNLFAGLLRCPECGGSVHIKSDSRHKQYLVCDRALAKACTGVRGARYDRVEEWFLIEADTLINDAPRGADLDREIDEARSNWHGLSVLIDEAAEAVTKNPDSRALALRLQKAEAELATAGASLKALLDRAERAQSRLVKVRLQSLREAVRVNPLNRMAVNLALRQAVERIVVEPGQLVLHWRHGGTSGCPFDWKPAVASREKTR